MPADLPVAAPDHAEARGTIAAARKRIEFLSVFVDTEAAASDLEALADLAAALLAERQQDKERIEEMDFALAFYADPVNYENESPSHVRPVITDQGAIARAALAVEEDAPACPSPESPCFCACHRDGETCFDCQQGRHRPREGVA